MEPGIPPGHLYSGSKVPEGHISTAATEQRRSATKDKGCRILTIEAEPLRVEKTRQTTDSDKASLLAFQQPKELDQTTSGDGINPGPRYVDFPWYRVGDQRLKCVVEAIYGPFDHDSINKEAIELIYKSEQGNRCSHIWDDAWLWYSLPDDQEKYFLFSWVNWDAGPTWVELSWMAVRGRPKYWEVRATDGSYLRPANDTQVKKRVVTNGYTVDLDFYNPENEGDWIRHDFLY